MTALADRFTALGRTQVHRLQDVLRRRLPVQLIVVLRVLRALPARQLERVTFTTGSLTRRIGDEHFRRVDAQERRIAERPRLLCKEADAERECGDGPDDGPDSRPSDR